MRRALCGLFLAAAVLGATASAPAATAKAELASKQYLIGTWRCTFTVGTHAGAYATTWSSILDGRWLRQSWDERSDTTSGFAFRAEFLNGFDEEKQFWVRFGVLSTGQYFAMRMHDTPDGGWSWRYISFLPRRPRTIVEPSTPDAALTRRSATTYTVDGPTYPDATGTTVTEHLRCRKAL